MHPVNQAHAAARMNILDLIEVQNFIAHIPLDRDIRFFGLDCFFIDWTRSGDSQPNALRFARLNELRHPGLIL
jgi:hypothetical protein